MLPLVLTALGACFVVDPSPVRAGSWASEVEAVSGNLGLSRTTPSNRYAALLPDGSLYAVWYVRVEALTAQIRGARRPPGGSAWLPDPAPLSAGSSLSTHPTLGVDAAGVCHVAWTDDRDGNNEIYYRQRLADGALGPEERLSTSEEKSAGPIVACGSTGRVSVVWTEGSQGNQKLRIRVRGPAGDWSTTRELTTADGDAESPAMQVDGAGYLHLVWQSSVLNPIPGIDDPSNIEIYYLRLSPDGLPQTPPYRVSNALGRSQHPSLAIGSDGAIHVLWSDNRDRAPGGFTFPTAIWYRRWLPGLGFGHEKRFVFNGADNLNPVAAVDGRGTINVVWENYAAGISELDYRQITPEFGWDPTTTRLTNTSGATQGPGILSEPDGTLHLFWTELRNSSELNVYYRRGQAGGQATP